MYTLSQNASLRKYETIYAQFKTIFRSLKYFDETNSLTLRITELFEIELEL